jgi:HSF-type DNA-binding
MPRAVSDSEAQHARTPAEQIRHLLRGENSRHEKGESELDAKDKKPGGIVIRGGRIRLPDKLMEFLTKSVLPDVLYWQEDGNSFSFDANTVQEKLLDKYFSGSKLTSFARSLNRWGFKRVFCSDTPKNVLSYEHPCFTRHNPEGVHYMNMLVSAPHQDSNQGASSSLPPSAGAAAPCHPINAHLFVTGLGVPAAPAAEVPFSIQSHDHVSATTSGDTSGQWEALSLLASSSSRTSLQQPLNGDAVRAVDAGNGLPAGGLLAMTMAQPRSSHGANIQQQNRQREEALQTLVIQRYLADQTQNMAVTGSQARPLGMPLLPPSLEHLAPLLQAAFSSGQASANAQQQQQQQPGLIQPQAVRAVLPQHRQPQQVQPLPVFVQSQNGPASDRRHELLLMLTQQCGQTLPQVVPSLLSQRPAQPHLGQTHAALSPRAATGSVAVVQSQNEPASDRRDELLTMLSQQRGQTLPQVIPSLLPQIPGQPQLGQTLAALSRAANSAVASTNAEIQLALASVLEQQQERNQFLSQLEVWAGLLSQIQNQGSSSGNNLN